MPISAPTVFLLPSLADVEESDAIITRAKMFVVDHHKEIFVKCDDGSITIGLMYLQRASDEFPFLDIIHELCHVKKYLEGQNLYNKDRSYVDRETEIEAYRGTVQEARRIGLSDEAITNYLGVSWITSKEHQRLAHRMDIPGEIRDYAQQLKTG